MRGGIFHEYMLARLEKAFQQIGLQTRRQSLSRKGRKIGYIDLLVYDSNSQFLAVEIEMDKKRTLNDTRKQKGIGDDTILWIVTPARGLALSIKKHLKSHGISENQRTFVLSFGAAMKRIANKNPFSFRA